jgi:phage baseplate assembly protein V
MMDVSDLIRIGQVTNIDHATGRCRVSFDDLRDVDGKPLESWPLAVTQQRTVRCQDYNMPDIGEHVVCVFLPSGIEEGFVIGSYYTARNMPKDGKAGLYRRSFDDGAMFEYDLNTKTARVKAVNIEVEGNVTVIGNLTVDGNIDATGKIIDTAGNTPHHTH